MRFCTLIVSLLIIFYNFFLDSVSLSELTPYPAYCQEAAENDAVFANFRQNPIYNIHLEHVGYEEGLRYLNFIKENYPDLIPKCKQFKLNDTLGNPVTYFYQGVGTISPTTLRYIKTAGDIRKEFGDDLKNMRIVEIGGGYGGLCRILKELCDFKSYTMIDLPPCNALAQKYLSLLGVEDVDFIENDALVLASEYDLVISNYAFSEIERSDQLEYLAEIIGPTPRGYMTLNFIMEDFFLEALSMNELISYLSAMGRKGCAAAEEPCTSPNNCLLIWKEKNDAYKTVLKEEEFITPSPDKQTGKAITYSLSGGRFGDNLIAYFHAKWAAMEYGIPLLFSPFSDAHLLKLKTRNPELRNEYRFEHQITIQKKSEIEKSDPSTLITVPYFPECKFEFNLPHMKNTLYYPVNWEDPLFRSEVVECLQPAVPVETLSLPSGIITVALHVRRGGTVDNNDELAAGAPLKAPPDEYYIDQIKTVGEIYKNQPLYVHIFTDDLNPASIVQKYQDVLDNPNIIFGWGGNGRTFANSTEEMLHDFYSMGKFDCLIRSMSNFSIMASMLGNYALMITPMGCHVVNGKVIVNQLEVKFQPL